MQKEALINLIEIILNDKISNLNKDINSLKESQKNDTKSSMGDKYETGRAMIQLELEKYHSRLSNNKEMLSILLKINPKLKTETIQSGSLIKTNHGWVIRYNTTVYHPGTIFNLICWEVHWSST